MSLDERNSTDAGPKRYDLEQMATQAEAEKAYDEAVKVRVDQEDILKLVKKRARKRS
jgi:hypothetical protein